MIGWCEMFDARNIMVDGGVIEWMKAVLTAQSTARLQAHQSTTAC